MKTNLGRRAVLIFVAGFLAVNAPCAEDLATKLQKGLFEEQANRDLNAAIKQYEEILKAAEDQRKIVATAMYRLAESYRKQGNEARANELYARLARDYSDQAEIMKELEGWREKNRDNSTLKVSSQSAAATGSALSLAQYLAEAAELRALLEQLEKVPLETLRWVLPTVRPEQASDVNLQGWRLAKIREKAGDLGNFPVSMLDKSIDERFKDILEALESAAATKERVAEGLLEQLKQELLRTPEPMRAQELHEQIMALTEMRGRFFGPHQELFYKIESLNAARDFDLWARVDLVLTLVSDADLQELVTRYRQAKKKLENPNLYSEKPESLRAAVSVLEEHIELKVEGIVAGLKITAEAKKAALDVVEERLNWAREESMKYAKAAPGEVVGSALEDRFAALEKVLQNSPDLLNAPATNDLTFLQHAAKTGNAELAEFMLAQGADVNGSRGGGSTPLHVAVANAHLRMAELLIKAGADPKARDRSGNTPLHLAAKNGYAEISEFLVQHGAEVNASSARRGVGRGSTPLHMAAEEGLIGEIKLLVEHGADLNALDGGGYTPLQNAITRYKLDAAMVLLEAGADPNAGSVSRSPLSYSIRRGLEPLVKELLEKGANPNTVYEAGRAPLHYAVAQWSPALVRLLLAHKTAPNAQDDKGRSALHDAAGLEKNPERGLEITNILLEGGADPKLADKAGYTPLHYAVSAEIAQALIEHGADVNAQAERKVTPLDVQRRNATVAAVIREAGGTNSAPNLVPPEVMLRRE